MFVKRVTANHPWPPEAVEQSCDCLFQPKLALGRMQKNKAPRAASPLQSNDALLGLWGALLRTTFGHLQPRRSHAAPYSCNGSSNNLLQNKCMQRSTYIAQPLRGLRPLRCPVPISSTSRKVLSLITIRCSLAWNALPGMRRELLTRTPSLLGRDSIACVTMASRSGEVTMWRRCRCNPFTRGHRLVLVRVYQHHRARRARKVQAGLFKRTPHWLQFHVPC